MEWVAILEMLKLIGAAAGGILSLITFATLIFKKPKQWFINMMKDANEEKFNQMENKMDEKFTAMDEKMEEKFTKVGDQLNAIQEFDKKTEETDICVIRHEITFIYEKYRDKGEIPSKMKENLCMLYENYKLRDGNSYVESIFKEMMHWKVI